jgi:hypothetical protein
MTGGNFTLDLCLSPTPTTNEKRKESKETRKQDSFLYFSLMVVVGHEFLLLSLLSL